MKRIEVKFRVKSDEHDRAKRIAAKRDWSVAALYRVALREFLEKLEAKR